MLSSSCRSNVRLLHGASNNLQSSVSQDALLPGPWDPWCGWNIIQNSAPSDWQKARESKAATGEWGAMWRQREVSGELPESRELAVRGGRQVSGELVGQPGHLGATRVLQDARGRCRWAGSHWRARELGIPGRWQLLPTPPLTSPQCACYRRYYHLTGDCLQNVLTIILPNIPWS